MPLGGNCSFVKAVIVVVVFVALVRSAAAVESGGQQQELVVSPQAVAVEQIIVEARHLWKQGRFDDARARLNDGRRIAAGDLALLAKLEGVAETSPVDASVQETFSVREQLAAVENPTIY